MRWQELRRLVIDSATAVSDVLKSVELEGGMRQSLGDKLLGRAQAAERHVSVLKAEVGIAELRIGELEEQLKLAREDEVKKKRLVAFVSALLPSTSAFMFLGLV